MTLHMIKAITLEENTNDQETCIGDIDRSSGFCLVCSICRRDKRVDRLHCRFADGRFRRDRKGVRE